MPHALCAVPTAIPPVRPLLRLAPSIEELAHGALTWVKAATATLLTALAMLTDLVAWPENRGLKRRSLLRDGRVESAFGWRH
jgi:hypothetical protein